MSEISADFLVTLNAFMDSQSEHIETMLGFLDEFRKALILRDLSRLQELQTQLAQEAEIRIQLDQAQRILQRKMAEIIGCRAQEACLSVLCRQLASPFRENMQHRQRQLVRQVRDLRQQHLATELLLRECARMNRRFLEMIVGTSEKGKTYDSHGRSSLQMKSGLMSMKL